MWRHSTTKFSLTIPVLFLASLPVVSCLPSQVAARQPSRSALSIITPAIPDLFDPRQHPRWMPAALYDSIRACSVPLPDSFKYMKPCLGAFDPLPFNTGIEGDHRRPLLIFLALVIAFLATSLPLQYLTLTTGHPTSSRRLNWLLNHTYFAVSMILGVIACAFWVHAYRFFAYFFASLYLLSLLVPLVLHFSPHAPKLSRLRSRLPFRRLTSSRAPWLCIAVLATVIQGLLLLFLGPLAGEANTHTGDYPLASSLPNPLCNNAMSAFLRTPWDSSSPSIMYARLDSLSRDVYAPCEYSSAASWVTIVFILAVFLLIVLLVAIWPSPWRSYRRVLCALNAFVAIGLAFGLMYHGLCVRSVARGNTLQLATLEFLCSTPRGPTDGSLPAAIPFNAIRHAALNFEAQSILTQDYPLPTALRSPRAGSDHVFSGTILFATDDRVVDPDLKVPADAAAVQAFNSPRPCVTNGDVLKAFEETATEIIGEVLPEAGLSFTVLFAGGADERRSKEDNRVLSEARARVLQSTLQTILGGNLTFGQSLDRVASQGTHLAAALRGSPPPVICIRPKDGRGDASALWPAYGPPLLPDTSTTDARQTLWRAASVDIIRETSGWYSEGPAATSLKRQTTLVDCVYFSFVSFTTTGYGDIRAVDGWMRFAVVVENIMEILFTAVIFVWSMKQHESESTRTAVEREVRVFR